MKEKINILILLICLFANSQGTKDTVFVTPLKPTFLDSLYFDLYNAEHCCCTQYYSKNVTVSDTLIILSYKSDDQQCMLCNCILAGSHTDFKCGPQKAGKYAIYKSETPYCPPGQICPALIIFKKVGEIIVTAPTNIKDYSTKIQNEATIKFVNSKNYLVFNIILNKSQIISMNIYDLKGNIVNKLIINKQLSKGNYTLSYNKNLIKNGIYVFKLIGEKFLYNKKIVIN